jgi:hypothetical protein
MIFTTRNRPLLWLPIRAFPTFVSEHYGPKVEHRTPKAPVVGSTPSPNAFRYHFFAVFRHLGDIIFGFSVQRFFFPMWKILSVIDDD